MKDSLSNEKPFDRGATDLFELESEDFGDIKKIKSVLRFVFERKIENRNPIVKDRPRQLKICTWLALEQSRY